MILTLILGVMTGGYCLALLWLVTGVIKTRSAEYAGTPSISVIVAARNEEENVQQLLASLEAQTYPKDKYEIVVINDGSTDSTEKLIQEFIDHSKIKTTLINSVNREHVISPKKNALTQGIKQANGEWLCLTDADCMPPKTWLHEMAKEFDTKTGMVIGFSPHKIGSLTPLVDHILALDTLAIAFVAAGSVGWDLPSTCSGRNLAYRKEVFEQVGGFEKIKNYVSGDDDLFMKLVFHETDWNIRYALNPQTLVPTLMTKSFRQFFHQRIRHASKGFAYEWQKTLLLILVYFFNLLLFIGVPLAFFSSFKTALYAFIIKSFSEFFVLGVFASKMKSMDFLKTFPIVALLHIPYIVIFALLGQFKAFSWKK